MSSEPIKMADVTIEQQIAQLKAAGWVAERKTRWRSPSGELFLGPHGAWKAMIAARRPAREQNPSLLAVAGPFNRSIFQHVESCLLLIEREQEKISPDNHLIDTLCDSVRMGREYAEYMRRSVR